MARLIRYWLDISWLEPDKKYLHIVSNDKRSNPSYVKTLGMLSFQIMLVLN